METILEILQSQRNPASTAVNVTHANGVTIPTVTIGTTVETPVETVVPNSGNRRMVLVDSTRLAATYPWGMPSHLAASLTHGGTFFPPPALSAAAAAGNTGFPWGLPNVQTTPIDVAESEDHYRGSRLHFQIPTQSVSASHVPNFPFGYPGATSMSMLTYLHSSTCRQGHLRPLMPRLEVNTLKQLTLLKLCHPISLTHLRCGSPQICLH